MRHGHSHNFVVIASGSRMRESGCANTPADGFWPEVASGYAQEDLAQPARENSPGRVFLEVLLVLGAAGLMVLAVAIWIPTMS